MNITDKNIDGGKAFDWGSSKKYVSLWSKMDRN